MECEKPLGDMLQVLFINPVNELTGVRQDAANERDGGKHLQHEHRRQEGFDDLLHAWGMPSGVQHFKATLVNGQDAALDNGVDQTVLGLEVIIDGSEIDLSLGGNIAQRSGIETFHTKELLGGVQNAGFSIERCGGFRRNHMFVLIIRLIHTGGQGKYSDDVIVEYTVE